MQVFPLCGSKVNVWEFYDFIWLNEGQFTLMQLLYWALSIKPGPKIVADLYPKCDRHHVLITYNYNIAF